MLNVRTHIFQVADVPFTLQTHAALKLAAFPRASFLMTVGPLKSDERAIFRPEIPWKARNLDAQGSASIKVIVRRVVT